MTASGAHERVFVALDMIDIAAAAKLAGALVGEAGGVKLGLEFFAAAGPEGVRAVARAGAPVFLDLKLHDIPNTVASAVRAVRVLNPAILTVHAAGGRAMLRAAAEEARAGAGPHPLVVAVTVLTSLDDGDLAEIGQGGAALDQVRRLAALAREAGLGGAVCSPREVAALRKDLGSDFLLVVPGIRPAAAANEDQKRVTTPAEAVRAGASLLVIGRPITRAADPVAAARAIAAEIAGA